jgi:nicotinamidase-related amidase
VKQTNVVGLLPEQVAVLMIDFQNGFCHPNTGKTNDKLANEATARRHGQ